MKRFLFFSILTIAFFIIAHVKAAPPNFDQIWKPPQLVNANLQPVKFMAQQQLLLTDANLAATPVKIMASQQQFLTDDVQIPYFSLSTFAGIVALISLFVTQIAKKRPQINEKAIFKILVSLAVGLSLTYIAWWSGLASFLVNMVWWEVLIQGIFAGLSACGLYDMLKGIGIVSGVDSVHNDSD